MNVAKIRFNDKYAPAAFTKSLKETGFGVITDHQIDLSLMERVYNEWEQFFNSDSKFEYLFDPQKQDGYFPLGTENAKGYSAKDHKEFFLRVPVLLKNNKVIEEGIFSRFRVLKNLFF